MESCGCLAGRCMMFGIRFGLGVMRIMVVFLGFFHKGGDV